MTTFKMVVCTKIEHKYRNKDAKCTNTTYQHPSNLINSIHYQNAYRVNYKYWINKL